MQVHNREPSFPGLILDGACLIIIMMARCMVFVFNPALNTGRQNRNTNHFVGMWSCMQRWPPWTDSQMKAFSSHVIFSGAWNWFRICAFLRRLLEVGRCSSHCLPELLAEPHESQAVWPVGRQFTVVGDGRLSQSTSCEPRQTRRPQVLAWSQDFSIGTVLAQEISWAASARRRRNACFTSTTLHRTKKSAHLYRELTRAYTAAPEREPQCTESFHQPSSKCHSTQSSSW